MSESDSLNDRCRSLPNGSWAAIEGVSPVATKSAVLGRPATGQEGCAARTGVGEVSPPGASADLA